MKTLPAQWAMATIVRKEGAINPQPQYQRGAVWSLAQKQLLIDSILRGMDIPKIYIRESTLSTKKRKQYQYEVIDGQQRLRAIWEFFKNEFGLPLDFDPVNGSRIAGLKYEDLPEKIKDELDTYQLSIVIISEVEDTDIEEMFLRLQNGTTLKAAERRNAISGKVREFIRNLTKNIFFKKIITFKNIRFAFDAVLAQMLALEIANGPTDIKDKDLEALYRDNSFNVKSRPAKDLKRILLFLYKEFKDKTPELKKQVLISIYLMSSDLLKNYNISQVLKRGALKDWFLNFESYKNRELLKPDDKRDSDIENYTLHVQQGTNTRESLAVRHEILMKFFLLSFPKIEYRDPQRLFSYSQRLAIFRRDKGKCRICKKKVDWDDFAVDHIKSHIKGGKTNLENGQLLCKACNLTKSAK